MNDFTKEEFDFLKWCVLQAKAHNPPIKGSTYIDGFSDMFKKIQSMIGDYCDHINTETYSDTVIKCMKCSQIKGFADE